MGTAWRSKYLLSSHASHAVNRHPHYGFVQPTPTPGALAGPEQPTLLAGPSCPKGDHHSRCPGGQMICASEFAVYRLQYGKILPTKLLETFFTAFP